MVMMIEDINKPVYKMVFIALHLPRKDIASSGEIRSAGLPDTFIGCETDPPAPIRKSLILCLSS